jgi:hypothetical protein
MAEGGEPQNPYPYEVLDCRAACVALSGSIQKETASAALASIETIAAASRDGVVPADELSSSCSIVVAATQSTVDNLFTIGSGDRWLLTTVGSRILVRRRWTGQVIHAAEFSAECSGFVIEHVISDRQSSHDNTDYALAELDFVLSSCIARTRLAPFRYPRSLAGTIGRGSLCVAGRPMDRWRSSDDVCTPKNSPLAFSQTSLPGRSVTG